jgi:hypothetical protein
MMYNYKRMDLITYNENGNQIPNEQIIGNIEEGTLVERDKKKKKKNKNRNKEFNAKK